MPSPRAVLHDLVRHGLDPAKPHTRIATDGRLAGHTIAPEPQLALKKLVVEDPKPTAVVEKKPESVKEETTTKQEEKTPEVPKKETKKVTKPATQGEKVVEEKKAETEEKPVS